MLAMIAMNGVFAGYELALAAISLARLRALDRENRPGARAALYMKEHMEASLVFIQLGITFFGAIAAATGGAGAEGTIAPVMERRLGLSPGLAEFFAIALIVVPLTIASVIFGELTPKIFALRNKEWICLRLSPIVRCFIVLARPVISLFELSVTGMVNGVHRLWRPAGGDPSRSEPAELKELQAIAQLAKASELIGSREESIILNAAKLSRRPVHSIMLPATHINMLNADDSLAECLIAAHLYMHTRFPVAERPGDPRSIVGYVNFKDIVALMRLAPQQVSLRGILRPIPRIPATASVATSMETMIREHTHIALIVDARGPVLGLITMEDVMQELVGEIQDEYDRLPVHIVRSGSGWVVGGGVSGSRLKDETGIDLAVFSDGAAVSILSDWISARLGRPVRGGDIIDYKGLRAVVRKIRRGKTVEAQLELIKSG